VTLPLSAVEHELSASPGTREATRAPRPRPEAVPKTLEPPRFLGVKPRARGASLVVRVSMPLLLLISWWAGSRAELIPESVLASPEQVVRAFAELRSSGQLAEFLAASLQRAGVGVSAGVLIGLSLGVLAGSSALGEELIDPSLQMLRTVPFLALIPLFISWFGIDEKFKIVLIASACAFPMYAYSYLGVRGVDRKIVEAARSFGVGRVSLLTRVVLPAALPNLLMALRICLSISVVGLIAAEQVGTTKGIGYLVLLAKQYYRPDYMVLCVVLYAALGLSFDAGIRVLERVLMPWRRHTTVRG
jgi:sulfonate transport system permease protein